MSDTAQVGGDHYQTPIQPIDYIMGNDLNFAEGNIIKYITRHRDKNGSQDVRKALHYCLFILQHEYGEIDQEDIEVVLFNIENTSPTQDAS